MILPERSALRLSSDNIQGLLAVDLFFIISGFVIFMTLIDSRNIADFAVSRFARLYPSYWVCVAVTVSVELCFPIASQALSLPQTIANATMIQAFIGYAPIEWAYWSLPYELSFYVLMGLLFMAGLIDRIELAGAVWLAASAILFKIFPAWGSCIPWRLQVATVLPYFPLFFAGILYFRAFRYGATMLRVILLAGCYATQIMGETASVAALHTVIFALIPLAVWVRPAALRWPPLIMLGSISYPLYLVHQSVGFRVQEWLVDDGLSAWLSFFTAIFAVVAVAYLVSVCVEQPARRWIRDAYRSRLVGSVPTAPV